MIVTALTTPGNSSKFKVVAKNGEFTLAMSYTLRSSIWELSDSEAELEAAKQLAEAVVSRHNPALPFKSLYIFAEHNTGPSLPNTIQHIRSSGFNG